MKFELRDFKYRETRLLTDYAELEEENIMLQKQLSTLRSSQVRIQKYEAHCCTFDNCFISSTNK
jgi:hypothetical protein